LVEENSCEPLHKAEFLARKTEGEVTEGSLVGLVPVLIGKGLHGLEQLLPLQSQDVLLLTLGVRLLPVVVADVLLLLKG